MKIRGIVLIPLLLVLIKAQANPVKPQDIIQKHGLEKIDPMLNISSNITASEHETISLCYQTLLFINAYKTLQKQIPIQNFENKLVSAINEIISLKNPKKGQSYQKCMQKMLLLNENPSIIYQMEKRLKLIHALQQQKHKTEKCFPSPE